MAWRVHLTDDVIYRIDILSGTPDVLVAWLNGARAAFFDVNTGASLGTLAIPTPDDQLADRDSPEWLAYLSNLTAPNGVKLPVVRLPNLTIHTTHSGHQRLYEDGHGLWVQLNGAPEIPLLNDTMPLVSIAADRQVALIAVLDEKGMLTIYQRNYLVGRFDIGLKPQWGILPELVLADNGAAIFASDGEHLIRVTNAGRVQQVRPMPYGIGKIACSPNGIYSATTDPETGIIRIYTSATLIFSHQKFAIDLYADAKAVQLLADIATPRVAVSALALDNKGILAFAMDGIITVSHLRAMHDISRPPSRV